MALNYYRSDGWVKAVQGQAIPGAQIYVCTQPANVTPPVTPPRTTPVPWQGPNPQALIYSDAGLTPIVQPIITDGFGHYDFYVLPGLYTVVVMFNGQVQQFYVDQSIGNVGSTTGSSVLFETNGTPNFNQLMQNLVQGAGITIVTDNLGNTTISATGGGGSAPTLKTNGVTNTNQAILNMISGSGIGLSADGSGGVTISNTTPATLPEPDQLRFALWSADISSAFQWFYTNDIINETDSGTANASVDPTSTAGKSVRLTHNYGGGSGVSRAYSGSTFVYPGRNTTWKGIANYSSTGSGETILMGLYGGNGSLDPLTNASSYILLSSGVNWTLITSDGVGVHSVSTGVPLVNGSREKFSFTLIGGVVTVYHNGVQVVTSSTNIPTAPLGLYWGMVQPGASLGVVTTGVIEYMYADNVTP